jgi:hypothetical protein
MTIVRDGVIHHDDASRRLITATCLQEVEGNEDKADGNAKDRLYKTSRKKTPVDIEVEFEASHQYHHHHHCHHHHHHPPRGQECHCPVPRL